MRVMISVAVLMPLLFMAAPSARADDSYTEWAPVGCQATPFVAAPAGGTCRTRSLTTENHQGRGGYGSCTYPEYSAASAEGNPGSPAFHLWSIVMPSSSTGYCYVTFLGPDQVVGRIKNLDNTTRQASGWTSPVAAGDATTMQFVSPAGGHCVGFAQSGAQEKVGVRSRVVGYYCQPRGAAAPADEVKRAVAYGRLRE